MEKNKKKSAWGAAISKGFMDKVKRETGYEDKKPSKPSDSAKNKSKKKSWYEKYTN